MTIHAVSGGAAVDVTPESAGWTYCGLRVVRLAPGTADEFDTGDREIFVLPLAGAHTVDADGAVFELAGRESVFSAVSDFAYVGRDTHVRLTGDGEVAIASARCTTRREPRYGPAADVPVETRGGGQSTRQVTNFGVPGVWDHAEKLMACEVLTPDGNWSSWPAHKHDASDPCRVANEELYYYRIAGPDTVTPSRQGLGLHRTYTDASHERAGLPALDETFEVRDGDVVAIPYGYHGPCVAAPGYAMYYLNVLAGPGDERSMAFCDDPEHTWVRDTWADEPTDPRCPMTSASGRVS